jgi:hypothetical protein
MYTKSVSTKNRLSMSAHLIRVRSLKTIFHLMVTGLDGTYRISGLSIGNAVIALGCAVGRHEGPRRTGTGRRPVWLGVQLTLFNRRESRMESGEMVKSSYGGRFNLAACADAVFAFHSLNVLR